jgi:hypothetical protein
MASDCPGCCAGCAADQYHDPPVEHRCGINNTAAWAAWAARITRQAQQLEARCVDARHPEFTRVHVCPLCLAQALEQGRT